MQPRNTLRVAAALAGVLALGTSAAHATPSANPSATLLGVDLAAITSAGKSSNDDVQLTIEYLNAYFGVSTIKYLGTLNGPGNNAPAPLPGETIRGAISGTTATFSASPYAVVAYDVKASSDNALYSLGLAGALSGTLDTSAILNNGGQHPAISHVDFFGCKDGCTATPSTNPGAPVPEPASLALLGAGLLGLALARRRATA